MKKGLLFIMLALIAGTGFVYETQASFATGPCPADQCCADVPHNLSRGYGWGDACREGCVPQLTTYGWVPHKYVCFRDFLGDFGNPRALWIDWGTFKAYRLPH